MNHPAPRPFNVNEQQATGFNLMASPEVPNVRIEAERIGASAIRYSVTSQLEAGRRFTSSVMAYPLGESDDWGLVAQGLMDTAYPNRAIRKLHGSMPARSRLSGLKDASAELAGMLRGAKDTDKFREFMREWRGRPGVDSMNFDISALFRAWRAEGVNYDVSEVNEEIRANIPVFTLGRAIEYSEQFLLDSEPSDVAKLLIKYSETVDVPALLKLFSESSARVPGLTELEQRNIENSVMRDEMRREWLESVHVVMDGLFITVKEEASFDGYMLSGGGYDSSVHIRRDDIPRHLRDKKGDIRVLVGSRLRDAERGGDMMPRYKVKFLRRKNVSVAHPQVVWVNDNGVRRFEYPSGSYEPSPLRPIIARSNSLLGAGVVANLVGVSKLGVDYKKELDRLVGRRSEYSAPLARAGMLGLVMHTKQDKVLADPYFEMMELEWRALQ